MAPRFDAVVFDWYATLGAPSPDDWWPRVRSLIEAEGAQVPPAAFERWSLPPVAHPEHSLDEATYRGYEAAQLDELLLDCGLSAPSRRRVGEAILELRDAEQIRTFPEVAEFLASLRSEGLRLGLCSNWSWDLHRHLEFNAIARFFDAIVCSAIVGYRKPHGEIFSALLGELGVSASRTAFVGDDWQADVEGATAAGLVAIHLAREGCAVEPHHDVPCVATLEELRPLLR